MKRIKSKKSTGSLSIGLGLLGMMFSIGLSMFGPLDFAQAKEEEFQYGAVMPVTGPIPQYGEFFIRGSQLALEDLEKGGWIKGKKIRIVLEDGKNDPKISLGGLNKLISIDKVPIVESVGSGVVLALGPVCQQNGVVLVNTAAQNPNVRKIGNFIFSLVPLADTVMVRTSEWAVKGMKAKTAALLYANYEFGRGVAETFTKLFEGYGGKIVATEIFPIGNTDFTTYLTKLKFVKADIIFYVGNEAELGYALKKAKQMGLKQRWLGAPGILNPTTLTIAGDAAEGLQAADYLFDPEFGTERMKNFGKRFKEHFGVMPAYASANTYNSIMLYAAALKAGATTAEQIREYYRSLKGFDSITAPIVFDKDGITQEQPVIREIRGGKPVLIQ
jgi:branched-chain amino acid transport system substrate-binding protein